MIIDASDPRLKQREGVYSNYDDDRRGFLARYVPFQYPILASACIAAYDNILYSRSRNLSQVLQVTGYWMIPITGMSLAFSSISYIAKNIRKKDDNTNEYIAAVPTLYILQRWKKNYYLTFLAAHGILAYIFRYPYKGNLVDTNPHLLMNIQYQDAYNRQLKLNIDTKSYYKNF